MRRGLLAGAVVRAFALLCVVVGVWGKDNLVELSLDGLKEKVLNTEGVWLIYAAGSPEDDKNLKVLKEVEFAVRCVYCELDAEAVCIYVFLVSRGLSLLILSSPLSLGIVPPYGSVFPTERLPKLV